MFRLSGASESHIWSHSFGSMSIYSNRWTGITGRKCIGIWCWVRSRRRKARFSALNSRLYLGLGYPDSMGLLISSNTLVYLTIVLASALGNVVLFPSSVVNPSFWMSHSTIGLKTQKYPSPAKLIRVNFVTRSCFLDLLNIRVRPPLTTPDPERS